MSVWKIHSRKREGGSGKDPFSKNVWVILETRIFKSEDVKDKSRREKSMSFHVWKIHSRRREGGMEDGMVLFRKMTPILETRIYL